MTNSVLRTNLALICSLLLAGCTDEGESSFGDSLTDPQLPPRGSVDLPQWIAAGHYQAWHCESAPHPGGGSSPHGPNRICNNEALHAATGTGAFPVGAASVKEIFDGDHIAVYAVSRKLTQGDGGDHWYWFEGRSGDVGANGQGLGGCTGCHLHADRDYVFIVVP